MTLQDYLDYDKRTPGTNTTNCNLDETTNDTPPPFTVILFPDDVTRWKMAWRAARSLGESDIKRASQIALRPRLGDFPTHLEIEKFCHYEVRDLVGFIMAPLFYGALHALAWSAHFGSPTQKWLWRLSSCAVMVGMPTPYFLSIVRNSITERDFITDRKGWTRHTLYKIVNWYITLLVVLCYVSARVYLVVGCFIQLFNLPAEVYDVPQ